MRFHPPLHELRGFQRCEREGMGRTLGRQGSSSRLL